MTRKKEKTKKEDGTSKKERRKVEMATGERVGGRDDVGWLFVFLYFVFLVYFVVSLFFSF